MIGFMPTLLVCVYIIYIQAKNAKSSDEKAQFYNGDYDCGYAEVRKGAFLFWWLYYAGGDKNTSFEKPLIIWIQEGQGNANFLEIGPQDIYQKNRSLSWVHKRNVLFIDSPVGSGFSFYNDPLLIVKTHEQLVKDLVELMKQFLQKLPKFKTVPSHIYSQSYGGKVVPRLAYYLHKEIEAGNMTMNLKSVGLGSSFVSPKDSTLAYPKYLFNMGLVDTIQYAKINNYSQASVKACDDGLYNKAHELRIAMMLFTPDFSSLNIFNILKPFHRSEKSEINILMNTTVKRALADVIPVNITYQSMNLDVFRAIHSEIMVPAIDFVEKILNETKLTITVYNGNLNAFLPIMGDMKWLHRLSWHGAMEFRKAVRHNFGTNGTGQYKKYDKLSYWWIYNGGHSVGDNLEAMEYILDMNVDPLH